MALVVRTVLYRTLIYETLLMANIENISYFHSGSSMFGWSSILIESDKTSREIAKTNLANNISNIRSFKFSNDKLEDGKTEYLLPRNDELESGKIKVLICNPPWFNGDLDHEKEVFGGEVRDLELQKITKERGK